jgi:hypothetical protein
MKAKTFFHAAVLMPLLLSSAAFAGETGKPAYKFYLGEAMEYVDGLASSDLVDSNTLEPKRESDMRSSTTALIQGLYEPDNASVFDFSYRLGANVYFDETRYNFVNNTLGAGYTHRLDERNLVSVRGDVSRALAGTGYDPYYWRGHGALAFGHGYTDNLSVVYGVDTYRYVFDDAGGLNATQTQISATPSYRFTAIPAIATVIFRATHNDAREEVNEYRSVDVIPRLTYFLDGGQFIQASAQYGHAKFDASDIYQTGVTRKDDLYRGSIAYFLPLADTPQTGHLLGYARYSYTRNDSTLDRQDYDSSIVTLGVTTRF